MTSIEDGLLPILVVGLALAAGGVWIASSLADIVRWVTGTGRHLRRLSKRIGIMEREIVMARESATEQQKRLAAIRPTLEIRQALLKEAEARLAALKTDGVRDYRLLNERYAVGETVFLFAVTAGEPKRVERWAVPAGHPEAAAKALAAVVKGEATMTDEGHL